MTKTELAKAVAKTVVGTSTSFLVGNVLRNNVDPKTQIQKAEILIATFVMGSIAAESAGKWTDQQIDKVIEWWSKNVTDKN